jgi:hypothetical protein
MLSLFISRVSTNMVVIMFCLLSVAIGFLSMLIADEFVH